MERRVGAGAWFAAAGGLALMAPLAFVGVGVVAGVQAAGSGVDAGVGDALAAASPAFGWAVLALLGVAVLDVVVACGLWMVFRGERPGAAALAATFRIAYTAVFVGAIAMLADARRIAEGAGAASGLGVDERDTAVLARLDGFDSAWNAGLVLFGMHLAVIGWLLLRRSGAFATIVGALVLLAGAGYLADSALWVLVPDGFAVAQFTFVGEIVLIAWLVVGGIRSIQAAVWTSLARATTDRARNRMMHEPRRRRDCRRDARRPIRNGRRMSYEEKGTWVYLVIAVVGYTVYLSLVLPQVDRRRRRRGVDYVPVMLWAIGGAIVASIVLAHPRRDHLPEREHQGRRARPRDRPARRARRQLVRRDRRTRRARARDARGRLASGSRTSCTCASCCRRSCRASRGWSPIAGACRHGEADEGHERHPLAAIPRRAR